jgi:hypothetical protein
MRSGSIRIGLGGDSYAYTDQDDALLSGLAKSNGWTYELAWDDTGKPYMGVLPEDGGKPNRWISVIHGPRGEAQSTVETFGKTPFIKVLGEKPTVQQPLPKVQDTVLTTDLKKQVDFWGFDDLTVGAKAGPLRKGGDSVGQIVGKDWAQSLGLPAIGAKASIKDMAQWLLILVAVGVGFVAIDFATKD